MMKNGIKNGFFGGLSRLFTGFVLGTGMVAILFWAMQAMIKMTEFEEQEKDPFKITPFVEVKADFEPAIIRDPPVKPPRPEPPPKQPPPPRIENQSVKANVIAVATARVDTEVNVSKKGFVVGAISDGKYLPVVKVAPIYPPRAVERGTEGQCTVVYTVTKQGSTANHRIDENDCSSRLFHEASITAAKRFRYKPTVRNGEAIDVSGVKNRFTYALDD